MKPKKKIKKLDFFKAAIAPTAASLMALFSSLIQTVASLLINAMSEKGVMRARKGHEGEILPLLALALMMKVMG